MGFAKDFVWGAAAASYQIEGAAREDGKGPSVWDMLAHAPGRIWNDQTGDVACDHYHRYREDVAIMKQIGLKAYRLSVSWPRVIPAGAGAVNPKGLAFYDRLVDELLAAGIQPYVTLFHWDYPYDLFCRGGWLSADSPQWFADYARVVADALSDRVRHWMTLNEPPCFIGGHQDGGLAPGLKLEFAEVLRAAHHTLLAHGRAVQVLRACAKAKPVVGMAPCGPNHYPASDRPADVEAARQLMFATTARNVWQNAWWLDPVFLGRYPEDGLKLFAAAVPPIRAGDMETIRQPLDFFGLNLYQGSPVRAGADGKPEGVPHPAGLGLTAFKWFLTPEALYWSPRFFWERYRCPIIITENGMSGTDWVALDGKVHDPARIDYMARYLLALRRAADDGVPVQGYFAWSILDNFEWCQGFKERFGLVHVDYETQKRTPKDSAFWYRDVIASNGASLG